MISPYKELALQFLPDEIAWLREVVEQCNEAASAEENAAEQL